MARHVEGLRDQNEIMVYNFGLQFLRKIEIADLGTDCERENKLLDCSVFID